MNNLFCSLTKNSFQIFKSYNFGLRTVYLQNANKLGLADTNLIYRNYCKNEGKVHEALLNYRSEIQKESKLESEYIAKIDTTKNLESIRQDLNKIEGNAVNSGLGTAESPLYTVATTSKDAWYYTKILTTFFFLGLTIYMFTRNDSIEIIKSKDTRMKPPDTKFSDVIGAESAKSDFEDIVDYLRNPEKYQALGAQLPKGVILTGPPGTGKTLLARAVAGEAGCSIHVTSGSDFEEMLVGVGASRVRKLFLQARKNAPSIIFIDEIDAMGTRKATPGMSGINQTLNSFLVELDGFVQNDRVVVIGATNVPQSLDPAMTRTGRFDRTIHVGLPTRQERKKMLEYYTKDLNLDENIDLERIAGKTVSMSGADLKTFINYARIETAKTNNLQVTNEILDDVLETVNLGKESTNPVTEMDMNITAYHEAGHTIVGLNNVGLSTVDKVSIVPRGPAGGVTWSVPNSESHFQTKKQLLEMMDVAMGGKAAEELVFGNDNVTGGCSSDLKKATEIAYAMVTQMGMGKMGPIVVSSQGTSQSTVRAVEEEVTQMCKDSLQRAKKIITKNRKQLNRLAEALLQYEILDANEINLVINGQKLPESRLSGEQNRIKKKEEKEQLESERRKHRIDQLKKTVDQLIKDNNKSKKEQEKEKVILDDKILENKVNKAFDSIKKREKIVLDAVQSINSDKKKLNDIVERQKKRKNEKKENETETETETETENQEKNQNQGKKKGVENEETKEIENIEKKASEISKENNENNENNDKIEKLALEKKTQSLKEEIVSLKNEKEALLQKKEDLLQKKEAQIQKKETLVQKKEDLLQKKEESKEESKTEGKKKEESLNIEKKEEQESKKTEENKKSENLETQNTENPKNSKNNDQ